MPSHLGKLYTNELVFVKAFDPAIVTALTSDPNDMEKISHVVTIAFKNMEIMRTTMLSTLTESTLGVILITAKAS